MSSITVTFDPEKLVSIATIAKEMGVTHSAASKWAKGQLEKQTIPPPLFTLPDGRGGVIWSGDDLEEILDLYRLSRSKRGVFDD